MRTNGYQTYLENEIFSATPLRLIQIMYAAALDTIAAARRSLRAGEIRARSRAITKAMRIVAELSRCLNRGAAGELSENLAQVYGYVLKLLLESNAKQIEAPLGEAERLLTILAEGWNQCGLGESVPEESEFAYGQGLSVGETQPVAW
jgi:flagellar protein FliS